jgi:4-amino-4-deoxy-L-arabinose transferase-like glycosyltransferase
MLLALFSARIRLPLISEEHKALILWGGWLLICLVFFSVAGFFHNYYLATLSPALAAMVGIGFAIFTKLMEHRRWLAVLGLCTCAAVTLAFQFYLVSQMGLKSVWIWSASALFVLAGIAFLVVLLGKRNHVVWEKYQVSLFRLANVLVIAALVLIPAVWSVRTVTSNTSNMMPAAYSGEQSNNGGFLDGGRNTLPPGGNGFGGVSDSTLSYLQENTKDMKYLLAVPSSHMGSDLVLKTGRAVLFMGGFSGSDPVVDSNDLAKLVADGDLRYVLYGGMQPGPSGTSTDVTDWIKSSCQVVSGIEQSTSSNPGTRGEGGSLLYQCGSL